MDANDQRTTESEDNKLNEWRESTRATLGRFRAHAEPFSISNVPEELHEGNKNAYMPKAIFIGPRYKGTTRSLLKLEETKWHYMQSLLHRGTKGAKTKLEKCVEVISGLEKEVRASYVDDLKLEWNDLANVMLCDACFLLELLIRGSKYLNEKLGKPLGPEAEVEKKEEVVTDLMVLENQIPLVILHKLSEQLFDEMYFVPIETLALNLFGYFPDASFKYFTPSIASHHFLELVHSYVSEDSEEQVLQQAQESWHVSIPINTRYLNFQAVLNPCANYASTLNVNRCAGCASTLNINRCAGCASTLNVNRCANCCASTPNVKGCADCPCDGDNEDINGSQYVSNAIRYIRYLAFHAELNRCAPILEAAGVTIITRSPGTEKKLDGPYQGVIRGFNFDIKFSKSNGALEIPPLHITKSAEVMWRNLIAWEQGHTGFGCKHKCTWAAFFFNGLICCGSDVQLLKDRGVIVDHLKMSNGKLLELFRSIIKGVDRGKISDSDSPHWEMVSHLNSYSGTTCLKVKRYSIILWHSWLPKAFRQIDRFVLRGYNLLIGMISVYALVQTIYTILGYYHRKIATCAEEGPSAGQKLGTTKNWIKCS